MAYSDCCDTVPPHPLSPRRGKRGPTYLIEERGYVTPCWIWQGSRNTKGYALRTNKEHGTYLVHRAVFSARHTLREGEYVHHLCEQKACVNPDHLEAQRHLAHCHIHGGAAYHAIMDALRSASVLRRRDLDRVVVAAGCKPTSTSGALLRMEARGEISRLSRGHYTLREEAA